MNISRTFILKPVATTLAMIAIFLGGLVAYRLLPVSALPEVDYPTIQVVSLYPGAGPDTMASLVTSPLERQFGQMPGLLQMTSSSSGGASVVTLQFGLDVQMSVAEQEVQAAINAASNLLPSDMPMPPVYNKVNPADRPVVTLAISSDNVPLHEARDLVETRMAQKLSQISGVGLVSIAGGQKPALRIQVNPTALAANGLALSDVRTAITAANVNQPTGNIDGPRRGTTIYANSQVKTAAEYNNLILAYNNGAPLRLKDVANTIESAEDVRQAAREVEHAFGIQRPGQAGLVDAHRRVGGDGVHAQARQRFHGVQVGLADGDDADRGLGRRTGQAVDAVAAGEGGDRLHAQVHAGFDRQRQEVARGVFQRSGRHVRIIGHVVGVDGGWRERMAAFDGFGHGLEGDPRARITRERPAPEREGLVFVDGRRMHDGHLPADQRRFAGVRDRGRHGGVVVAHHHQLLRGR